MTVRVLGIALWAYAVWLLLTWTATAEQLTFGAVLAVLVGLAIAPLGNVAGPWTLLNPRRLAAVFSLIALSLVRIVRANLSLSRRILSPSRPLRSGMVVVPTQLRTDAAVGAAGLITSLIVDNQIVDLDLDRRELQYHCVDVPDGSDDQQREAINGPTERLVRRIDRRNP